MVQSLITSKLRVLLLGHVTLTLPVVAWFLLDMWRHPGSETEIILAFAALSLLALSALTNAGIALRGWSVRSSCRFDFLLFSAIAFLTIVYVLHMHYRPSLIGQSPTTLNVLIFAFALVGSALYCLAYLHRPCSVSK